MNNLSQIVDLLESNVSKLLLRNEFLIKENVSLKQQNKELNSQIAEQKDYINDLKDEYESLKVANAIVGSKEDVHFTKIKINTLIREIDKCIAQLSE
jgi:peptidoglycan hydrolase CwlO-like protein